RNLGKPLGGLLVSGVIDLARCDFAPPFNPQPAKITFAVPDQERLCWGAGDPDTQFVRHLMSNVEHPRSNVECTMLNCGVRGSMLLGRKLCPYWRVIGWVFSAAHFVIDAGRDAFFRQAFACQYGVNAQPAIFFECAHLIVPPAEKFAFLVMDSQGVV